MLAWQKWVKFLEKKEKNSTHKSLILCGYRRTFFLDDFFHRHAHNGCKNLVMVLKDLEFIRSKYIE